MTYSCITFARAWLITHITRSDRGASLVEYVLLLTGIAILVIAAVTFFGGRVNDKWSETGSSLPF